VFRAGGGAGGGGSCFAPREGRVDVSRVLDGLELGAEEELPDDPDPHLDCCCDTKS